MFIAKHCFSVLPLSKQAVLAELGLVVVMVVHQHLMSGFHHMVKHWEGMVGMRVCTRERKHQCNWFIIRAFSLFLGSEAIIQLAPDSEAIDTHATQPLLYFLLPTVMASHPVLEGLISEESEGS